MYYRKLFPYESDMIKQHLKSLSQEDKRMRFFSAISDAGIDHYIDDLNWHNSLLWGAFENFKLCGVAELRDMFGEIPEFAVTVLPDFQHKGVGKQLLKRILLSAQNFGLDKISMEYLVENRKMKKLAQTIHHPVKLKRVDFHEEIAEVDLPKRNFFTLLEEFQQYYPFVT